MKNYRYVAALAAVCLAAPPAFAEITLDGTLGFSEPLEGPDYAIEARLGQQMGKNLFHSFQIFNLDMGETASFSGPDGIANIISRVTGGEASHIDGTLRATIPGADLYFLNPAGVMFGPNARLDIRGSFHVSSADYLRLGDTGQFNAAYPEQSTLSMASPAAFGFLTESPAGISKDHGFLEVPEGKTLGFIGGDLKFEEGLAMLENTPDTLEKSPTFIRARGGRINLVSVASPGEVTADPETMAAKNNFEKFGVITLSDTTTASENLKLNSEIGNVDASGSGGGRVYIHGGQITLNNTYVFADTLGGEDGQGISVNAADELTLSNGSLITAQVFSENSSKKATGDAGNILIKAKDIRLRDGAQINSSVWPEAF
ncbi:MAG: filamentous hemagglutinin N-terminal domain-containing protein, partial [Gammaproteobacteria bacterium]|nr:filamentous hemagglutinin N-terminal domain-containing protein [Gammaproteobacteria bacterium]